MAHAAALRDHLGAFLAAHAYLAVGLGCFMEGESFLIAGGVAASQGVLSLSGVMVAAFCGGFATDQLCFAAGRHLGAPLLRRYPRWAAPVSRAQGLLARHQTPFMLGIRFMYGLRMVAPFALGTSAVRASRFLLLDAVGAAVWASTVGTVGYLFGHALAPAWAALRQRGGLGWAAAGGALVAAIGVGGYLAYRRASR